MPGCHYLFLAGPCQFIESRKRFQLRQDGGEIFRHRRVNMHRALDHRVGAFAYMTVMRLVVSGLLNKQVADELGITESTVKAQRDVVMQKMKAMARKRSLLRPRWFRRKQPNSFEKNGGDDETRTRDLCRDS